MLLFIGPVHVQDGVQNNASSIAVGFTRGAGARPALAPAARSSGLTLPPLRLGLAGYSQVNLQSLYSSRSLSALWFWPLSLLEASQLAHCSFFFFFFPGDGFLHPFSKDKTNCLFNLPRNKWARGGVGREAYLLFLWADLPGYFLRDSSLTHLISLPPL